MKQLRIIIYLFVCFYPPPKKKLKKERLIVYFRNPQDKSYLMKLLRMFVCLFLLPPPPPHRKKTKKRKNVLYFWNHQDKHWVVFPAFPGGISWVHLASCNFVCIRQISYWQRNSCNLQLIRNNYNKIVYISCSRTSSNWTFLLTIPNLLINLFSHENCLWWQGNAAGQDAWAR